MTEEKLPDEIILRIKCQPDRIPSTNVVHTARRKNFLYHLLNHVAFLPDYERKRSIGVSPPFDAMILENANDWQALCDAIKEAIDDLSGKSCQEEVIP